jgi:hypothetical protein
MNIKNIFKIAIPLVVALLFWSAITVLLNNDVNKLSSGKTYSGLVINNNKLIEYDINKSYQFNNISERSIIIRLDDVQGYLWNKTSIRIIDTVLEKNMSITLGVIPERSIDKDILLKNYLISNINDPRIEIAQHGTTHDPNEILNLSEEETYNKTNIGFKTIIDILGVKPITYIPPNNEHNANSTKALSKLGFKILSSKKESYTFDGNMVHVGYDVQTMYSFAKEPIPINEIIDGCNESLNSKNLCVIMVHPQDFHQGTNRTIDEQRFNKFIGLLDGLNRLNARSVTFKDLMK